MIGELYENLPVEIVWNIIKFIRHPCSEIMMEIVGLKDFVPDDVNKLIFKFVGLEPREFVKEIDFHIKNYRKYLWDMKLDEDELNKCDNDNNNYWLFHEHILMKSKREPEAGCWCTGIFIEDGLCILCNTQEAYNIDTTSDTDIDSDSEIAEIRRLRSHMLIEFDDGSD